MKFYLFYSDKCIHCKNIINLIKSENLFDMCQLVSIEQKDKIPISIKTVPTIIAKELNKPLSGKDAFDWIHNIKFFNQTTNNVNKLNIINPDIKPDDLSYNKLETSTISDKYTNISDEYIKKNMLDYDKINSNIIILK